MKKMYDIKLSNSTINRAFTTALLTLCFLLISCNSDYNKNSNIHNNFQKNQAQQALKPTLSKILPLAEILTNDNPSLEAMLKILGIQNIRLYSTQCISLDATGYSANIHFQIGDKTPTLDSVSIHIEPFGSIRFDDITPVLGTWKLIHESKTSSVMFLYKNPRNNKIAAIYADLFDSPRSPKSPVQRIIIRRGYPPLEQK